MLELIYTLVGGIFGVITSHYYYKKVHVELSNDLAELKAGIRFKKSLAYFERALVENNWVRELINNQPVWLCVEDPTLQITESEECTPFDEPWVRAYPDPKGYRWGLYLKIDSLIVKELNFVSIDGGRIFVPLPRFLPSSDGKRKFVWYRDSLEFKVGRIVGTYYIYNTLERVAKTSSIEIQ